MMMMRWAMAGLLAVTVAGCVPPYNHHRNHDGWNGWNWNDDRRGRDHDHDHDDDNGCNRPWCDND